MGIGAVERAKLKEGLREGLSRLEEELGRLIEGYLGGELSLEEYVELRVKVEKRFEEKALENLRELRRASHSPKR